MPLSDTAIRNAKLGTTPYKLYDGDGLFLLLKPSGSRLWRLVRLQERAVANTWPTNEDEGPAHRSARTAVTRAPGWVETRYGAWSLSVSVSYERKATDQQQHTECSATQAWIFRR